ncbi:MAG: class I SAM-dependent methyltransferase, partial [bacterium]|nr:class I SAM-dependent methyltransferase [bacterium]
MAMQIHPLGNFGGMVKNYEKGRRNYPGQVFKFLKSLIKVKKPLILDVGCGTGIATRQLAKFGTVIGADPDPIMLSAARKHRTPAVKKYVVAKADKLPFKSNTFDVVTAFSAFHWFADKKSVSEIKRVLKPHGIFFVAGKSGIKSWGQGYRRAIIKSIRRQTAQFVTAKGFDSKRIMMKQGGFRNVRH